MITHFKKDQISITNKIVPVDLVFRHKVQYGQLWMQTPDNTSLDWLSSIQKLFKSCYNLIIWFTLLQFEACFYFNTDFQSETKYVTYILRAKLLSIGDWLLMQPHRGVHAKM